jgi:hypothetical protein
MGLRPTQGNEKRLGPSSTLYGTRYPFLVISTGANPDFLPRSARQGRVCARTPRSGIHALWNVTLSLSSRPERSGAEGPAVLRDFPLQTPSKTL